MTEGIRQSARQTAPGLRIGKSKIDGMGCFATVAFRKGRKIVELAGELVSRREAARRMHGRRRLHICAINSYWGIDSSVGGNGSQFINHSCRPNSFVRIMHDHVIFFALRDIEPGEEITLDYVESYHPNDYRCRCGAEGCRGTINRRRQGQTAEGRSRRRAAEGRKQTVEGSQD